jgi:hypothetical protein
MGFIELAPGSFRDAVGKLLDGIVCHFFAPFWARSKANPKNTNSVQLCQVGRIYFSYFSYLHGVIKN